MFTYVFGSLGGEMKKKVLLILTLAAMMLCVSCSNTKEEKDVDFNAVKESLENTAKNLPEMSVADSSSEDGKESFEYLFDIEYDKIEQYYFTYSSAGTAEEIAIIKLKNSADAEEMKKALEEHVQDRISLLQTYSPEQVEMTEKAVISVQGKFVSLIICENASEVKASFEEIIK